MVSDAFKHNNIEQDITCRKPLYNKHRVFVNGLRQLNFNHNIGIKRQRQCKPTHNFLWFSTLIKPLVQNPWTKLL